MSFKKLATDFESATKKLIKEIGEPKSKIEPFYPYSSNIDYEVFARAEEDLITGLDVNHPEMVQIDEFGNLVYAVQDKYGNVKFFRVALYLRDVSLNAYEDADEILAGRRYHITYCSHLATMEKANRYHEYKIATGNNNKLEVNYMYGREVQRTHEHSFPVCQYCLEDLKWEGFYYSRNNGHERRRIVDNFTLERFYQTYGKSFFEDKHLKDLSNAYSEPKDRYPPNWDKISFRMRTEAKWKCELCHADCSHDRLKRYLHTHHKDKIPQHNHRDNLQVLCANCHSKKHENNLMLKEMAVQFELEKKKILQAKFNQRF